mmetsp:Transcript_19036/g.48844  ORF Transcript_19036/g.48844 Transcript_19036/m.48844 type:complete len:252 (-) Transcript_19036:1375-2130(-)
MIVSFFGGSFLALASSLRSSSPSSQPDCSGAASPASPSIRPAPTFVRRRMYGLMRDRSCSERCFLSSTAQTLAPRTLPRSIGSLKVLTNVAWLPSNPGCAKSISAQRSCSAFWTGVPVSSRRQSACRRRRLFPSSVEMFFILCASSQTTMSHGLVVPELGRTAGNSTSCCSSALSSSPRPSSSSFLRRFAARISQADRAFLPRRCSGDGASSTPTWSRSSTLPMSAYDVRRSPPWGRMTLRSALARCAVVP